MYTGFFGELKPLKIVSVIHMFDLMPGASRQNEATSIQHKINLTEISVCRAGNQEDQYIVFIDEHRDLFCATVKRVQSQDDEIYKIGKTNFKTAFEFPTSKL